jgi:hypothetical protein
MIDRPKGRVLPKLVAMRGGDTVRALAGTSASMSVTRHTPYSLKKNQEHSPDCSSFLQSQSRNVK